MRSFLLRLSLMVLILMGTLGSFSPAPTMAEEPPLNTPLPLPAACALNGVEPAEPDHWMAVWNFDSAQGCIMYTGAQPDPQVPPPILDYDLIDCTNVGGVEFANGYAIFNGSSYLTCTLAVDPNNPAEEYANYDNFWMYAQVGLTPMLSRNPIFDHPSATLSAPIQSLHLQATLSWTFRHADQTSSTGTTSGFFPSYDDHLRIASCHEQTPLCSDHPATTYAQVPRINGVNQPIHPVLSAVRFQKTAPIYIGYSPRTRSYFRGNMGMLLIDPPGIGHDPRPNALPMPRPVEPQ